MIGEESNYLQQDDDSSDEFKTIITINDTTTLEITITKDDDGIIIPVPNFYTCCRSGDAETLKLLLQAFKTGKFTLDNLLATNTTSDGSSNSYTAGSILSKIASFFSYGAKSSNDAGNTTNITNFFSPHGKNKSFQRTPLHYACRFGHMECVKTLIEEVPHLQLSGKSYEFLCTKCQR